MKNILLILLLITSNLSYGQITFEQANKNLGKTEEEIKAGMLNYIDYKYKGRNDKEKGYLICYRNMKDESVLTHIIFRFNEKKICSRIDLVYIYMVEGFVNLVDELDKNLKKVKENHYTDAKYNYVIILSDTFDKNGYHENFTIQISKI